MNKATAKRSIIIFTLTFGLLAIASTSFACWNCRGGYGPGITSENTNLTTEQQQQLDAVKEKYAEQLNELQASLNRKADEYQSAETNDSTTVGTLKQLDAEMADLEQKYWALLDKANNEAGGYVAGEQGPWFNCGYNDCNHRNHVGNKSYGRHMGPNHQRGMHGSHMDCCW